MTNTQEILDYVNEWQTKRFRETEITLSDATLSLSTDDPLVVAKPGVNNSRWALFNTETNRVAVLAHAGIWGWKCDLYTGNFVPEGCEAPEGLPETRIQDTPSYKCEFSYAFDTTVDGSIWDHMQILEDHVTAQPGFNKGSRPRRGWQNGRNPSLRQKYIMSSKVFAKRTPLNSKEGGEYNVSYEVHPWIMHGVDNFPEAHQIPNPERPKYYDYTNNILRKLEDTNNPTFLKNDIVWMSFRVAFIVSGEGWWPEIIPIEFIRVGRIPEHLVIKSEPGTFPALGADFEDLETGAPITVIDGPSRPLKRKMSMEDMDTDVQGLSKKPNIEADIHASDSTEDTPDSPPKGPGNSSKWNLKTRSKGNKTSTRT